MIDVAGATQALGKISDNKALASMGINSSSYTQKSSWSAAIDGSYSLLSPLIHLDFPSRKDIIQYIHSVVQKALDLHQRQSLHSQPQYSATGQPTIIAPDMTLESIFLYPMTAPILKQGRKVEPPTQVNFADGDTSGIEIGVPQQVAILANPASKSFSLLSV